MIRRAFTLIELVLTLLILATLAGFTLSAISKVRGQQAAVGCQASMRQAGLHVLAYANDYRDYPPNAGPVLHDIVLPTGHRVAVGSWQNYTTGLWTAAVPDEWSPLDGWSRGATCPAQPRFDRSRRWSFALSLDQINAPVPMYYLSEAFAVDYTLITVRYKPGSIPLQIRAFKLSDVLFPARKSLLNEDIPYCVTDPADREWVRVSKFAYTVPASYFAVDGSVHRKRIFNNVIALGIPFGGVRGVDW